MDLILDIKLSWKPNITNRLRKASIGVGKEMGPETQDDSLNLHRGGQSYPNLRMAGKVGIPE